MPYTNPRGLQSQWCDVRVLARIPQGGHPLLATVHRTASGGKGAKKHRPPDPSGGRGTLGSSNRAASASALQAGEAGYPSFVDDHCPENAPLHPTNPCARQGCKVSGCHLPSRKRLPPLSCLPRRLPMSLLHQIRLRGPWEFFSSDAIDGDLTGSISRTSGNVCVKSGTGPAAATIPPLDRPANASHQLKVRIPMGADGCGVEVNGRPIERSPDERESAVWLLPELELSNVLVITLSGGDDGDWSTWQEPSRPRNPRSAPPAADPRGTAIVDSARGLTRGVRRLGPFHDAGAFSAARCSADFLLGPQAPGYSCASTTAATLKHFEWSGPSRRSPGRPELLRAAAAPTAEECFCS